MSDTVSDAAPIATQAAGAPAPVARNVVTEAVGTTLVMLAGPGLLTLSGVAANDLAVALSFGLAVAISIGVIGAVANPAFTLALLVVREVSLREAVGDWIGQLVGGGLGGALIFGLNGLERQSGGANGWDRNGFADLGTVMAAELVFGVVIVVVLLSAISKGLSLTAIAGFTGAASAIAALVMIDLDGIGLNPARSIGSAVFAEADPNAIGQLWPFVVMPLVAAVAAVFVWLAIDAAEVDDTIFDETIVDDLHDQLTDDD
ncbi:MAG: aquaporin [Ilumatobacter sp.]